MEKLIEMERAGIALYIFGPGFHGTFHKTWNILAKKNDDGIKLEIDVSAGELPEAIDDLYERWIKASKGLPNHSLKQIDHVPPPAPINLDDEIPF